MAPRSPKSASPKGVQQRRKGGGFVRKLFNIVLVLALLGAVGLGIAVATTMASLPDFDELMRSPNGQSVEVRGTDGSVIAAIGPSYGEWLPFARIPGTMTAAMVAVEDRRFYGHPGIDPIGIARSVVVNVRAGHNVQGASTITQQLARNIFLTSNKTYGRKIREVVLSLAIERKFTKRAILELYLNRVYFGGGAYGIDAAARKFFGHSASSLSLEEAAIIAGLVKAPSHYAPSADPLRAKTRAATVIATMADSGAISATEAASADIAALRFAPQERSSGARYFTDWVLSQLEDLTDERVASLIVSTTLDAKMQQQAEAGIAAETPAGAQGGLVSLAPDGAVRAMVGGRDYVTSNYNRAVAARRQPGSSFKLFVYVSALEDGVSPDDRVVDEPVTIDGWSPKNSNGKFLGPMTVRNAFAQSVNTVAVQLAARVGFDTVADTARRFGLTTPIDRRPAMALGSSDVTLLEMTAAYAAIAAGGTEVRPYGITRITNASGNVLFERETAAPRVLVAPYVAAKMTDLLKAAVETGTGKAAQIGRPLAGKTGTTSSNKDGWFLGFTSELTTGVWMGRDDAQAVPGLAGGRAPARAFAAFMSRAVGGTPPAPLTTEVQADAASGLEPDDAVYGITPEATPQGAELGADGQPVNGVRPDVLAPEHEAVPDARPANAAPPRAEAQRLDQKWLDSTLQTAPRP